MEVDIKFEREGREGIIPVGTYLFDAARRFGIDLECEIIGKTDEMFDCAVQILKGKELLSDFTKLEMEQLSDAGRKNGERLARQAKIEKSGEVVIMTKEKVKEEKEEAKEKQEQYRKEFEELPLEKKIASLMELEGIALSETFSFILNSPYKIGEKIIDVLAEFGLKFEKEAKEAATPSEHKAEEKTEEKAEKKVESETKTEAETKDNSEAETKAKAAPEKPKTVSKTRKNKTSDK